MRFLKNHVVFLCLILIIAAFFRLYNITHIPPGLYSDEAMNGNNASEALETGNFKVFYSENNGREGLFMNLQALSVSLFGHEPWALRIVSAVFGIFTVLGLYYLGRELFMSEPLALLAAFFLSTSFWHILFSRIGFRAIMAPFFLAWAMYFFLVGVRRAHILAHTSVFILAAIMAGVFLGLGFYSYIAFRVMPILLLLAALLFFFFEHDWKIRRRILLSFALMTIITIIIVTPLAIYFLHHPQDLLGRTAQISIRNASRPLQALAFNIATTMGMFNVVGDWNWRQNYAGSPELAFVVGIFFLIGIWAGVRALFTPHVVETDRTIKPIHLSKTAFLICFAWLILAAAPVVLSNEGLPHALRSILMIPPVFLLSAAGAINAYNLLKSIWGPRIRHAVCAALFVFLIIDAYQSYFVAWVQNPKVPPAFNADIAKRAYDIRALPDARPKYVIIDASEQELHDIGMPAQTFMFLTDSYTAQGRERHRIFYVRPRDTSAIPQGAYQMMLPK